MPENVRVLEGAMTRVMAIASLLSEPLTTPIVRRALGGRRRRAGPDRGAADAERDPGRRLRRQRADARRSCSRRGARRGSPASRQLAMYLARELTPLSLTEIARGFDRDHTTVLHAIRSVSSRLEPGSETAEAHPQGPLDPGDEAGAGAIRPPRRGMIHRPAGS